MVMLEKLISRYFDYLGSIGTCNNAIIGLVCAAGIGAFDLLAPDEATHSFLYIFPIAFVTWFSGIRLGMSILVVCTIFWSVNNTGDTFIISIWNVISTVLFFTSIAVLLQRTRDMWENEKKLSRIDLLTGAKNFRAFSELAEYEIFHSQREGLPFSLAYLDIDNFKQVNDTYGHATGDALLKSIVSNMALHLRRTDVIGRLGGDEFVIFFPATDQPSVKIVMQKVQHEFTKLMENNAWPATVSIGVLTCASGTQNLENLITYADTLMYEVKRSGKNSIRFAVYHPEDTIEQGPPLTSSLAALPERG